MIKNFYVFLKFWGFWKNYEFNRSDLLDGLKITGFFLKKCLIDSLQNSQTINIRQRLIDTLSNEENTWFSHINKGLILFIRKGPKGTKGEFVSFRKNITNITYNTTPKHIQRPPQKTIAYFSSMTVTYYSWYFKPLSQPKVTIFSLGDISRASLIAPTTFIPVDVPQKIHVFEQGLFSFQKLRLDLLHKID